MAFNRQARDRISRQVKLAEQSITPQYRQRQRRQAPSSGGGKISLYAEITGLVKLGPNRVLYSWAKMIPEEQDESDSGFPKLIRDPEAPPRTDTDHWEKSGAVHIARSEHVPAGTRVFLERGGPEGHMQFEVFEPFMGAVAETGAGQSPGKVGGSSPGLWRLNYSESNQLVAVRIPGAAVWKIMRGGLRDGAIFNAIWNRDRYVILSVDPFDNVSEYSQSDYDA